MMDYRLALLLHVPLGFKITNADLDSILGADPFCPQIARRLVSATAQAYFEGQRNWLAESMDILKTSDRQGVRWSYIGQADYPKAWLSLSSRPVVFSYLGTPCWMTMPMLSVVGSRTPSTETLRWMQRELTKFLHVRQVGVVSGGARGVDQWAHRLALARGRPTICVLPSGLLNPYPFDKEELWQSIREGGGAMLSTCGLYAGMSKSFFHIRNRWIAGLSEICLVVEANRRSGSLITAKLAVAEHKTVCTLPVFPTAEQGLGNLDLLADGAMMLRDHVDLQVLWDRSGPTAS